MKTQCIFFFVLLSCISSVYGRQAFSYAALDNFHNHAAISFTVAESNAYQYRVLCGSDTTALEILGTIKPVGNKRFGATYHYEVYEPLFKYYQVVQIGMDSRCVYSKVICTQKQEPEAAPPAAGQKQHTGNVLAKNK